MSFDFPEELKFVAYLGRENGFSAGSQTGQPSQAEREWRMRWEDLPTRRFAAKFAMEHWADPRMVSRYAPPDFANVASSPALQALCLAQWPAFQQVWNGQKIPSASKIREQLQRIRIQEIVANAAKATGKKGNPVLYFMADFVIWPEDYLRVVLQHHVVFGAQYAEPGLASKLRETVAEHVSRIIIMMP
jgi:hypothetical protein